MNQGPTPSHLWRWFDPRNRKAGSWAFIINRITGLGLTLYLMMHLVALSQLAQGPGAYDGFIALAKSPAFKFLEMFVIAGGILHGLNGIRIALTSFGIGVRHERQLFWGAMALGAVLIAFFGLSIFSGA